MSAPERYRVTLRCGHLSTPKPSVAAREEYCRTCGRFQPVRYIIDAGPPRSLWTRLLGWILDRIYGPWRG